MGNIAFAEEDNPEFGFSASFNLTTLITDPTASPMTRVRCLDTGASHHMSPYCEEFSDFVSIPLKPIHATDKRTFMATGRGTITVLLPNGDKNTTVRLFDDGHVDGVVREQDFADVAEQDAGCRLVNR